MKILRNIIRTMLTENSSSRIVQIGKETIDKIRSINQSINQELKNIEYQHPNIYAKGGAARLALLIYSDIINGTSFHSDDFIRDSDYVYIGIWKDYQDLDLDIDEFETTFDSYFDSRDITLNEVLLSKDKLIFTRRAFNDLIDKEINPSKNQKSVYNNVVEVSGRLFSRLLLFASRYNYKIPKAIKPNYVDDFNLLVCLLKSYELGIQHKYFDYVRVHNMVNNSTNVGEWLLELLNGQEGFQLWDRDKYIINDLVNLDVSKEKIKKSLEYLYSHKPELKKQVALINSEDIDYSRFFRKPNRK